MKLKKSSFVKNILVVMTGSAIAQASGFILTPIISRLYSPSDFGVFGSFEAVLSVIAAAITLDYAQAIMLPRQKNDALNLLAVSFASTIIISLGCLAAILIAPGLLAGLIQLRKSWILILFLIGVLLSGINTSLQAWCIRVKAFKATAVSQIVRNLSSKGTQIGLGLSGLGPGGLVAGTILGNLAASLNLMKVLLADISTNKQAIRPGRMQQLLKEYKDFPLYSASKNVINAISQGLPVLLLTRFYGNEVAGAYAFSVGVLSVPMSFVLTALRQVLFQKACEAKNSGGSLQSLYNKTTIGLFAVAVVPSFVLILWLPRIFGLVFGSRWEVAGDLSRSLIVWLMIAFCNLPAVLFARVIRKQRFVFFYDLFLLGVRMLSLVLGGMYLSANKTVMLYSLAGAVMNAVLIFSVGYAIMKDEKKTKVSMSTR